MIEIPEHIKDLMFDALLDSGMDADYARAFDSNSIIIDIVTALGNEFNASDVIEFMRLQRELSSRIVSDVFYEKGCAPDLTQEEILANTIDIGTRQPIRIKGSE